MTLGKWMVVGAMLYGAWASLGPDEKSSFGNGSFSEEELRALAATVGRGDIVMYGFESCPACKQARTWLNHHQFSYSVCDIHVDARCNQQLQEFGQNAVPYLIVKGEHLEGFNSREVISVLAREYHAR